MICDFDDSIIADRLPGPSRIPLRPQAKAAVTVRSAADLGGRKSSRDDPLAPFYREARAEKAEEVGNRCAFSIVPGSFTSRNRICGPTTAATMSRESLIAVGSVARAMRNRSGGCVLCASSNGCIDTRDRGFCATRSRKSRANAQIRMSLIRLHFFWSTPSVILTTRQLNELKEVHKSKMGDEDKWRVYAYDKGKSLDSLHVTL